MKTTIFCFSGTGNSLEVAKILKGKLENAHMEHIAQYDDSEEVIISGNVVIVSPVYFFELPKIVIRFVKKLKIEEGSSFRSILTCGGMAGYANNQLEKILISKGAKLSLGIVIPLADNSIVSRAGVYEIDRRMELANEGIEKIFRSLLDTTESESQDEYNVKNRFMSYLMKFGLDKIYKYNKKYCDETLCNRCGMCAQVCPVNNISLEKGFPQWVNGGRDCEQCFACINWCQSTAVRFGKIDAMGKQYTHPNTKIINIINQKEGVNNEKERIIWEK